MNNDPVAVVDSGVGGLACLGAIRKAMPNENIIYFGDTANMPYGTKSTEEIIGCADRFGKILIGLGAKMIILACGTLSSTVIPFFYRNYPQILIQGVIDPAVGAVSRACKDGDRVGVIATPRSIESGAYQTAFERLSKKLQVSYMGCPDLSVYIEKGVTDGPEMEALLHSYLDKMVNEDGIETLLLGCTHYPLVGECINRLYPDLKLIGPEAALAKSASVLLRVHGLDSGREEEGSLDIFASKKTESFALMADKLGLGDYPVTEVEL